jgi:hypothetical protein
MKGFATGKSRLWLEFCGKGHLPQTPAKSFQPIKGETPWGSPPESLDNLIFALFDLEANLKELNAISVQPQKIRARRLEPKAKKTKICSLRCGIAILVHQQQCVECARKAKHKTKVA